jgi:hypothetical protein
MLLNTAFAVGFPVDVILHLWLNPGENISA